MHFANSKIVALAGILAFAIGCGDEKKEEEAQCSSATDGTVAAALDELPEGCPTGGMGPVADQPDQNQGTGGSGPNVPIDDAASCSAPKKRDPNTNTCVDMTLADAKDSATCHLLSAKWYGDKCNANAITCDNENKVAATGESCIPKVIADWTTYDDCAAHDGYWYDPTDVTKTSAVEFAALSPTCHATATDSCPVSGTIGLGRESDNSIDTVDVQSYSFWNGWDYDEVLSTLRCFQSLETLDLSYADITKIDVRANTALETLYLTGTQISSLDLSKNTALRILDIRENAFTAPINLTPLTSLEYIGIGVTGAMSISNVNFAQHPNLKSLNLAGSDLSTFNFNTLPAYLTELNLSQTNLTSLDLTRFTQLRTIWIWGNFSMTSVNLTGLTALNEVSISYSGLTSIDVTGLPNLYYLSLQGNSISSIDLSQNTLLMDLDLSNNSAMLAIDLSANTGLFGLNLSGMSIAGALDLSTMTQLYYVNVTESAWSSVDLTGSEFLNYFSAGNMPNFALDFNKFHSGYFTGPYSSMMIEEAKWLSATGTPPAWTGTEWYDGIFNYSPSM